MIFDGNEDEYNNMNLSWMMRLQQGDQVKLLQHLGKLYVTRNLHIIWTGNLLKADA